MDTSPVSPTFERRSSRTSPLHSPSNRSAVWFGVLLVCTLTVSPTVSFAQEDPSGGSQSEQDAADREASDSEDDPEPERASGEEKADDEKADDEKADDEKADVEKADDEKPDDETKSSKEQKGAEEKQADREGDEKSAGEEKPPKEGEEAAEGPKSKTPGDKKTTSPPKPPREESAAEEKPDDERETTTKGAASKKAAERDEETEDEDQEKKEGESPIADLAEKTEDDGFEPVEDIDESSLEQITPAKVYPYLEWGGWFRVRSEAAVNFDLDTGGTSAIRPPLETSKPLDNPAKGGNELLWGTDMGLRLDPTIHISEMLRVHLETAILDNVVFGSLSDNRLTGTDRLGGITPIRPDPTRTVFEGNQLSPREREWFEDALQVTELWGEVDTFLGEFRAGRMDNHWGLGMHANSGDCPDCDFGDHVDRIRFMTKPLGWFYTSAAIDFPDQGVTSQSPHQVDGQPYDLSHIDDARQYTFSIFRKPRTDKEDKLQQQKLKEDQIPVINGGARFTYRNQKGLYVPDAGLDRRGRFDGTLVYQGLNMYVPDLWVKFLYNPEPDTYVRVELEGVGVFGDIDNATRRRVGNDEVNCFDEADRESNPEVCSTNDQADNTSQGINQLGAALESELYFGGPVRFGLNGGYASGSDAPNWGYRATNGAQHEFYRFDPNYHVDLILFREVIGTVTNAYYANPYAQARFFESADQRMEAQLDVIASRASDIDGTPAGDEGNRWLGLELDAAIRYLQIGRFQAGLEGGVLFPFEGLDGKLNRPRLTRPGGAASTFSNDSDATIPWTIQSNLIWKF